MNGSTDFWGHTASEFQSGVSVANGKITGTLKYFEGWGSGTLADPGYFVALKFATDDWADYTSVKVGVEPSYGTGLVELINDPDKNGVFRVTDKDAQLFKVVCSNATTSTTKTYTLNGLVLESDEA